MVQLAHRNTRRYGGYIVHFGVIVIMIGFAGAAFNQDKEQEMGYGDKMNLGAYTLVCRSYTQEDKPNYSSEWAIIDVFKGGKQIRSVSGAAFLQSQPANGYHGRQPVHVQRGSVPGV
jgi:cytochrome c-type biogenesis protein CcmF